MRIVKVGIGSIGLAALGAGWLAVRGLRGLRGRGNLWAVSTVVMLIAFAAANPVTANGERAQTVTTIGSDAVAPASEGTFRERMIGGVEPASAPSATLADSGPTIDLGAPAPGQNVPAPGQPAVHTTTAAPAPTAPAAPATTAAPAPTPPTAPAAPAPMESGNAIPYCPNPIGDALPCLAADAAGGPVLIIPDSYGGEEDGGARRGVVRDACVMDVVEPTPCYWDAGRRGNGQGSPYWADESGNVHYIGQ